MNQLNETDFLTAVMDLSKGNPGAVTALMEIIPSKDPRCGVLLGLVHGHEELRGSPIYVLWSDLAGRDVSKAMDILFNVPLKVLREAMLVQDYSGRQMIAPYMEKAQEGQADD